MKWPLLGHKTSKWHSWGHLPYFLFTPRGKVENFGTFPGSHFLPKKSSGRICQLGELEQWLEHPTPGTRGHWGPGSMQVSPPGEGSQSRDWDFTSWCFLFSPLFDFLVTLKDKIQCEVSKLRQNLQIFPKLLLLQFYTFCYLFPCSTFFTPSFPFSSYFWFISNLFTLHTSIPPPPFPEQVLWEIRIRREKGENGIKDGWSSRQRTLAIQGSKSPPAERIA